MKRRRFALRPLALLFASMIAVFGGAAGGLLGACGPFADVALDSFCPFVLEIFYLGITTGTTPTTYDPSSTVTRLQMAAFLSRTVDRTLQRANPRAALGRFSTLGGPFSLGITTVGGTQPTMLASDGKDVWAGDSLGSSVWRVRGSDGKLLETWTGANFAGGVLSAAGKIFVTGTSPGLLYRIDPSQPAGAVTTVASGVGGFPFGIAFDGARIWTANTSGSVCIVTPAASLPWTATTVSVGFDGPQGIVFDGANMWVTDAGPGTLLKLDANGAVLQTVTVGAGPDKPAFDGNNIWVPNATSSSVSVVRASNGTVLATLTGNGIAGSEAIAFDGQRILVANYGATANSVSIFKAADLTPLGTFSTGPGTRPFGACSDGTHFWIALSAAGKIAKF